MYKRENCNSLSDHRSTKIKKRRDPVGLLYDKNGYFFLVVFIKLRLLHLFLAALHLQMRKQAVVFLKKNRTGKRNRNTLLSEPRSNYKVKRFSLFLVVCVFLKSGYAVVWTRKPVWTLVVVKVLLQRFQKSPLPVFPCSIKGVRKASQCPVVRCRVTTTRLRIHLSRLANSAFACYLEFLSAHFPSKLMHLKTQIHRPITKAS